MTALSVGVARAQQTATVVRADEPIFGEIGGPRLGQLAEGATFATGPARSNHTQITLEGWVFRASLKATTQAGHTLVIDRSPAENLRDDLNGHVLGQLVDGFLLDEVERRGQWVKVRRQVWVASAGLRSTAAASANRPSQPATSPATATRPVQPLATQPGPTTRQQLAAQSTGPQTPDASRAVVRRRMQLFRAPDSTAIGQLEAGTPVRITARAGGWVRVEAQAWVRENEIRPSDTAILTGVSAAELRGAPEDFKGRLLRWTIQYLALQTADELRSDLLPGQKYILARGPAPEYAFVYIIVPADRLTEVQRLEPLATVSVVARVINGRSQYLANPILELVELP